MSSSTETPQPTTGKPSIRQQFKSAASKAETQPDEMIDYCGTLFYSAPPIHHKIDVLKRNYPGLWRQIHTRTVVEPPTHPPNSWLSMILCEGVIAVQQTVTPTRPVGHTNVAVFAGLMKQYGFPTYYVSSDLWSALRHTHPPVNQTWECVPFPFPAIVFMLPRGAIQHPRDGFNIDMIGVCKAKSSNNEDRVCVMYPCCERSTTDTAAIPLTEQLEPSVGWLNAHTDWTVEHITDSETSAYIFGIAANLLLAMAARRELVQLGDEKGGKRLPKPGTLVKYNPTWLGFNYHIVYEAGTSPRGTPSGHFTELGWRCGHYRLQRHGQGRKDTKVIWIEPYMAHTRKLSATT